MARFELLNDLNMMLLLLLLGRICDAHRLQSLHKYLHRVLNRLMVLDSKQFFFISNYIRNELDSLPLI